MEHAMPNILRLMIHASMLAALAVVETANAQPFGVGMRGWGSGQDVMGPAR